MTQSSDASTLRDQYYRKEIFNVGDIVEDLQGATIPYRIMRRGANHVLLQTESGDIVSKWIYDVSPSNKDFYLKDVLLGESSYTKRDKMKVAKIVAESIEIDAIDKYKTPESLIDVSLRKLNEKTIRPEYAVVINKMFKVVEDVGISFDKTLLPEDKRTADLELTKDVVTDPHGRILRDKNGFPRRHKSRAHVVDFKASDIHGRIDYKEDSQQNNEHYQLSTEITSMMDHEKHSISEILDEIATATILGKDTSGLKKQLHHIKYAIDKRNEIDRELYFKGTGLEKYGDDDMYDDPDEDEHHKVRFHGREPKPGHTLAKGQPDYVRKMKYNKIAEESEDDKLIDHIKSVMSTVKPAVHKDSTSSDHDREACTHHEGDHLTFDELQALAADVNDLDDIIHIYDPEELAMIDADTGEHITNLAEEYNRLDEVLSHAERIKAALRFAQMHNRLQRRIAIALHRHSSPQVLNRRATRMAISIIKKKLAGGRQYETLSYEEKERVDRLLGTMHTKVKALAMLLLGKVRDIENKRLAHSQFTQPPAMDQ